LALVRSLGLRACLVITGSSRFFSSSSSSLSLSSLSLSLSLSLPLLSLLLPRLT